ncbi:MAG TPA: hypothetical protein VFZ23_18495 [Pyrinomonadaceae bacterium]
MSRKICHGFFLYAGVDRWYVVDVLERRHPCLHECEARKIAAA